MRDTSKQKWIYLLAIIVIYRFLIGSFEGLLKFYIIFLVTAFVGIFAYLKIYSKQSGKIRFITTYSTTLKWQLVTNGLFTFIPFVVAGYFVGFFDVAPKYISSLPNFAVELALILSGIHIIISKIRGNN